MKKKMIAISALFLFAVAFLLNVNSKKNLEKFTSKSFEINMAFGSGDETYGFMACGPCDKGICPMCDGTRFDYETWGPLIGCRYGGILGEETK